MVEAVLAESGPAAGRPRGRLARFSGRFAERGPRAALAKLIGDHVFRRSSSVIMEYHRGWGEAGRGSVQPDWLTLVTVRDAAALPPLCAWMAHRAHDFARMLDDGKLALFALCEGVAVGCVWVSLVDHHDAASREHYAVGPGEAYHYCWMVDPSLRRTNLALPLCRYVIHTLAGLGIKRQFGVVDRVNRASYLIQARFGYRECGVEVIHYYILGTRWTRMRPYAGTLGLIAEAR